MRVCVGLRASVLMRLAAFNSVELAVTGTGIRQTRGPKFAFRRDAFSVIFHLTGTAAPPAAPFLHFPAASWAAATVL